MPFDKFLLVLFLIKTTISLYLVAANKKRNGDAIMNNFTGKITLPSACYLIFFHTFACYVFLQR